MDLSLVGVVFAEMVLMGKLLHISRQSVGVRVKPSLDVLVFTGAVYILLSVLS